MQRYGEEIYRHDPTRAREQKPLRALWVQWYVGLLIPALMTAMLPETRVPDCAPEYIHVRFHETGRPALFWLDIVEDKVAHYLNTRQRLERLIQRHLQPVINAIAQQGEINARLIWNNTGYQIYRFLAELRHEMNIETEQSLIQALFYNPQFTDGSANPLWRTMIPGDRGNGLQRRSCCQRYRLPTVKCCGDCPLKPV